MYAAYHTASIAHTLHAGIPPTHLHYIPLLRMDCPHLGGWPAGGNSDYGGSGDTSLITPSVACPPQCGRGTHLWACKTHERRGMMYGLELWQQNICPGLLAIPKLYKSIRWLQGNKARSLGTNVTPKLRITVYFCNCIHKDT